ncbi:unnamed protein product [Moneuplotes crassus]|uniref:Amino acid transporter transmembrane domain-containing protein n=1 Tax=Euplotes crassus TaxID=5936 RepID=A0AAD1X6A7_EUPCR|nr:unnamed protein product [Moneuplotes crassus]
MQTNTNVAPDTATNSVVENSRISTPVGILSIISFIIGAALVALPYSAYHMGIFTIPYHIFNCVCAIYSIHLFLKCAEVTGHDSTARIGCEVLGKSSLYLVNSLQIIVFGMLPIAYLIIIGQSLSSMLRWIDKIDSKYRHSLGDQWFSIVVLSLLLAPWIFKRKFEDLKVIGVILFSTTIIFATSFFFLCVFFKTPWLDHYQNINWNKLMKPEFDNEFFASLSTPLVAYGFQSAFFPVYNSLKEKNYTQGIISTILAMTFCFLIYMMVIFASLPTFGEEICRDVLHNLHSDGNRHSWQGILLKSLYIVILIGHFPYVFLMANKSLLGIIALLCIRGETQNETENIESGESFQNPHVRSRLVPTERVQLLSAENNQQYEAGQLHKLAAKTQDYDELNHTDESMIEIENSKPSDTNLEFGSNSLIQVLSAEDTNVETVSSSWRRLIYYSVTISLYLVIVLSACFIHNVESVIRLVGSIGNSFLNFTFPGLFYFVIMRRHGVNNSWWQLGLALTLCIYGIVTGILLTGFNIFVHPEVRVKECLD